MVLETKGPHMAAGESTAHAGRMATSWARAIRRWMLVPWGCLTVGIILGGWWSYEVLGWGGYWAWDPVENASFMPWLTATAFIHSSMVMERKQHLKGWTITLLLSTFLLMRSLMSVMTFLVPTTKRVISWQEGKRS